MRKAYVTGNWKMNTTPESAAKLVRDLAVQLTKTVNVDVGLAPPFVCLPAVRDAVRASGKPFLLGGQNVHGEKNGAFTGEISAEMLRSVGCDFAIVGHSERRQFFGETDEGVNRRVRGALAGGLSVIVCMGETLDERKADRMRDVVGRQTRGALADLSAADMARVTLAYEPVWAIGTGVNATPEQAQEVHAYVRSLLKERFGPAVADGVRIQYGGSVKAANAATLMRCPDVDGALVGGASLKADEFARIVEAAHR